MIHPPSLLWKGTAAIAVAVALTTFAAGSAQAGGDKTKGAKLAREWCNSCHTVARADSSRKFDAGPQFVDLAEKSAAYLRVAIDKPHDFMPNFPKLTGEDKQDLVAYIRALK